MAVIRIILGIVIGIAVGIGLVMLGDYINHQLWPPPPEVQVTNPEAIRAYMQSAPITSLLGLPVAWTIAAFAGAFVGAKVSARTWAGWIAGGALFVATGLNLAMIPHPLWMLIAALICVPLAAWFGGKLGAA